MARAFATFANGGTRVDGRVLGNRPRAVLSVDRGRRTEENAPLGQQVLDPENNATLTWMLEQVVEDGTGERAAIPGRAVAGKTGTTENYGDAWFVGGNDDLTVAVWVGYADTVQPMEYEHAGGPVAAGQYDDTDAAGAGGAAPRAAIRRQPPLPRTVRMPRAVRAA